MEQSEIKNKAISRTRNEKRKYLRDDMKPQARRREIKHATKEEKTEKGEFKMRQKWVFYLEKTSVRKNHQYKKNSIETNKPQHGKNDMI